MPYFTVHLLCQQALDSQARHGLKTLAAMTANLLVTMKAGNCLAQPQQSLVGVTAKQVQQHTHTHAHWLQQVKVKLQTASHTPSLSVAHGSYLKTVFYGVSIFSKASIETFSQLPQYLKLVYCSTLHPVWWYSWENNSSIQNWSKPILENHFPCSVCVFTCAVF